MDNRPDRAFLERAVALSDPDALRATLVQLTADAELAALPPASQMDKAQRRLLDTRAVDWLAANAAPALLPEPPAAELRSLMELVTGGPMGDLEFEARREIPGFRDFPFMAEWEWDPLESTCRHASLSIL